MANSSDLYNVWNPRDGDEDKPLPVKVAERITRLIEDDAHRAGTKLPNEYALAERLGVGRSTVREAIKILASKNILEVRHGSGTFVSERTGIMDDPLGFRFYRSKKKLAQSLCDIRLMLEPEVAALAAEHATLPQLDALELICEEVAALFEAGLDYGAKDIELHVKIAEASENVVAPRIVGIISTAIPIAIHRGGGGRRDEIIAGHRKVVEAIRKRNARQARKAMLEHIKSDRHRIDGLPDDF